MPVTRQKHPMQPTHNAGLMLAWRIYLLIGAALSVGVLVNFLLAAPQSEVGVLFGMSFMRLGMLLVVLAVLTGLVWQLVATWLAPKKSDLLLARLSVWLNNQRLWTLALAGSILLSAAGFFSLTLTPEISEPYTQAYFVRLAPLLVLFSGLSAQSSIALLLFRRTIIWQTIRPARWVYTLFLLANLAIFLTWGWVVRHQLVHEIDLIGWYELGIPLMGWQVTLAGITSLIGMVLIWRQDLQVRRRPLDKLTLGRRFDLVFSILLWLATVCLWNAIPIQPTWFVSELRPPNFEYYPNSDALKYDLSAQNLLVGEGWEFDGMPFVRRPLHSLFLVIIHRLGGQDYTSLVFWQILFLATLPVAFYFLTTALANRPAGIFASVLVAIREANSIAIATTITASHAKLLMSDLPATLMIVISMGLAVRWLKRRNSSPYLPTLTGFTLGLALLIRSELGFVALAILGISLVVYRGRFRTWLTQAGVFMLGMILVITPLIWRNWSVTGLIFLDSPSFRFEKLIERFDTVNYSAPEELEGEESVPIEDSGQLENPTPVSTPVILPTVAVTPAPSAETQDNPPLPYLEYVTRTIHRLGDIVRANGLAVMRFFIANFTNSQVQTYTLLPMTYRGFDSLLGYTGHGETSRLWYDCCSLLGYVRRLPFWRTWDGIFPRQTIIPLLTNLLLIAFGIGLTWQRVRWVALLPILTSTVHFSINAIFRNSGGRFIMPVDWTYLLFFSIGVVEIIYLFLNGISSRPMGRDFSIKPSGGDSVTTQRLSGKKYRTSSYPILLAGIFLVGSSLPLAEYSVHPVYTAEKQTAMLDNLFRSPLLTPADQQELNTFMQQGGQVLVGVGLYPRFYRANQGEPGTHEALGPRPFPRLGFYLVGPENQPVVLPYTTPLEVFPNASPVLVFSCPDQSILAVAVFEAEQPLAIYLADPRPEILTCPLDYSFILTEP